MARTISLHQLTALDAAPGDLIAIAATLDVRQVCVFTHVPQAAAGFYPMVARTDVAAIRAALRDAGVRPSNIEVFPLDADGPLDHLLDGLETGAELGAERATAHLHDIASEQQAIDRFAAFADRARGFGIVAGLEFNNFSAVRDVRTAARIVRAAGHGAMVLDALHLVRGGHGPADVAADADLVTYAQLSDGPLDLDPSARWREAVSERMPPGAGALPLIDIVRALPADAVFDIEVPQSVARKNGVGALERCRVAVAATRDVLRRADGEVAA